jgi:hypothetical protein
LTQSIQSLEELQGVSVHSGFIKPPMAEDLGRRSLGGVEEYRTKIDSLHPLVHVADPDNVAYGVLYASGGQIRDGK